MKYTRSLLFVAVAAAAAVPAHAAERFGTLNTIPSGFYWGADFGQYKYDLSQGSLDNSLADAIVAGGGSIVSGSSDLSKDGFTWGITLGYQILPYVAVEAAYVDLGSAEYKANGTVSDGETTAPMRATITADSSGATLSALGILPFANGWNVYGRVGAYFGSSDSHVGVSVNNVDGSASDSSSSQTFVWGGGVGYTRGQWTTRLDYQQFTDVGGDRAATQTDIGRITLGAVYRTDFAF